MADIIELIYADHDWFRRQFFYLDEARTDEELAAAWEPLAIRLDTHAEAEETIFYPALLQGRRGGRPRGRDRGRHPRPQQDPRCGARGPKHEVGSDDWFAAVGTPGRRTASISRRRSARGCRTSSRAPRQNCGTSSR